MFTITGKKITVDDCYEWLYDHDDKNRMSSFLSNVGVAIMFAFPQVLKDVEAERIIELDGMRAINHITSDREFAAFAVYVLGTYPNVEEEIWNYYEGNNRLAEYRMLDTYASKVIWGVCVDNK